MFESMSIEFMNLKTALLEEDLIAKCSKFLFNSSAWLCYMALGAEASDFKRETIISKLDKLDLLTKPSSPFNLTILSLIPEYFLTNIVDFIIFLNRFKESSICDQLSSTDNNNEEEEQSDYLNSFVSLILTFMGRSDRVFNPHIRASLAEAIECLVPKKQPSALVRRSLAYEAFGKHACSAYLSEALLGVFVSIEMTGQSVQFEQKFNYRRPMYELIEYLWNMPKLLEGSDVERSLLKQHRIKLKVIF